MHKINKMLETCNFPFLNTSHMHILFMTFYPLLATMPRASENKAQLYTCCLSLIYTKNIYTTNLQSYTQMHTSKTHALIPTQVCML